MSGKGRAADRRHAETRQVSRQSLPASRERMHRRGPGCLSARARSGAGTAGVEQVPDQATFADILLELELAPSLAARVACCNPGRTFRTRALLRPQDKMHG